MARQFRLTLTYEILESEKDCTPLELTLIRSAQEATKNAYAPYSGFLVGAALLLDDDTIYTGNNQENAAFPSGLCAERTALFGLRSLFPDKTIKQLAVTARKSGDSLFVGATPCGSCRQVMAEYENRQNSPIKVLIQTGPSEFYRCQSVSDLLPLQFSMKSLL